MVPRRYRSALDFCLALLLASAAGFAADIPALTNYTPAAGKELEALRKAKVDWLAKKIKQEETHLRNQQQQGADTTALEKELDQDKDDEKGLKEKDALDPSKNSDAGKHAKVLKKNVDAWIEELETERQSLVRHAEDDPKKAKAQIAEAEKLGNSEDALKGDLGKAEKASPKLFE